MRLLAWLVATAGILLLAGCSDDAPTASRSPSSEAHGAGAAEGQSCPLDAGVCAFATQLSASVQTHDVEAIMAHSMPLEYECQGPDPDDGLGRPYSLCHDAPAGERRAGYPVGRLNSDAGVIGETYLREELAGWLAWAHTADAGDHDAYGSGALQVTGAGCPLLRDGVRLPSDASACTDQFAVVFSGLYRAAPTGTPYRGTGIFLVERPSDEPFRIIGFAQGGLADEDTAVVLGGGSGTVFGLPFAPGRPVFGTFWSWTPSTGGVSPTPPPSAPATVTPHHSQRVSSALLTTNRDRLAICVDGLREVAAAVPEARTRVERALIAVAQHPSYVQAGLAAPPVVDEGCPHEPYLLQPGVFWENGIPITGAGPVVQEASVYRLFVFLLPPESLDRVIHGHLSIRRTAEEMLCQGHQCYEVTTGLYLTPAEAADEPFLIGWLTKGLGLEPTVSLVTPPDVPRGR